MRSTKGVNRNKNHIAHMGLVASRGPDEAGEISRMRATDQHRIQTAAKRRTDSLGRLGPPPISAERTTQRANRNLVADARNERRAHLPQFARPLLALAFFTLILQPPIVQAEALHFSPFTPADQTFTIDLPAEPKLGERKTWFPISRFVTRIYTSQVGEEEFGINSTQLPRLIGWLSSDGMILNSARDGILEDSNATLVALERFKIRKQSAQAMVFSIPAQDGLPDLVGQARMLITQNRLYILWTETTPSVSDQALDSFFASFRIGDWTPFAKAAEALNQPAGEGRVEDRSPAPQ